MVVTLLFGAFTHGELLARCLVGFGGALTTRGSCSRENSSVSSTGSILYRFVDSNTGGWSGREVGKTALSCI